VRAESWVAAGALGVVAGAAVRATVSRYHEQLLLARRPRGPDGIVIGGHAVSLDASDTRAVLVLHGFGDTPQSVAPVAHALHIAGWTVRAPLLAGHGRSMREMATHGAADWLATARDAYAALRRSHTHVALVGQSMGGALAVQLAVEAPPPGVVLLAPYLQMPAPIWRTSHLLQLLAPVVPYWTSRTPPRSIHDPAALARARAHVATSATALAELRRVSDGARAVLPRLASPTLVLQSREDNRIAPTTAAETFARIGAATKRLEWFTGRGHVLAVDYAHDEIAARVIAWLDHPAD
jgi:carboxylesterase